MVIHDMWSWKPLEDPCGSIRTLGKSHPTTCPMHASIAIKTVKRARQQSIEQDGKIVLFRKKAVTFMFHATYETQIENIMQQGIKPGRTQTCRGRQHVHMACIDDIIYDDQESDAALTHVSKGRNAESLKKEPPCQNTRSIQAASSQHSIPMDSPC